MMFDHHQFIEILEKFPVERVIDALGEMITPEREERIDHVLKGRIPHVQVAIEAPADVHNALAVVRSAEAMGVSAVHIIASQMSKGRGKRTTKGTSRWTNICYHDDLNTFSKEIRRVGFGLAGAVVDAPLKLNQIDLTQPICLMFGNEQRGLTDEAKEECDQLYTIPMSGMVESFNLSVAAGISLYDVVNRLKEKQGLEGELFLREKAYYFVKTLGFDLSKKILARVG